MNTTPNYLVVTKGYGKQLFLAEDVNGLLWCTAQYFGFDKPVLKLGILGCSNVSDKVEMYNTFATTRDCEIGQIYEVGRKVYERPD